MPLASAARREPELNAIDFTVSSSLPPMVTGGLAGEMELSVPYLYPKPGVMCPTRYLRDRQVEPMFVVRMQWWGDGGPGTVFKPGLLRGRDEDGERARRARMSKATCALFPVRCGLDGLLTYLKDMGSIALEVLVHEGEPRGARHVGRCVIPVGSWGGQLNAHPGSRESGVVAEGYFPVLSLDGNKYAGDLGVCLRACLGGSSKLRNVLAVAKMAVDKTSMGGERKDIVEALGGGTTLLPTDIERSAAAALGRGSGEEELPGSGRGNGQGILRPGEAYGGLPARASFDSADITDGSDEGSHATAAVAAAAAATSRLPRDSAPLSSFQLNEALAKFDASGTLPIWPTPKGSLYHPPEIRGETPPTPRVGLGKPQGRGRLGAGVNAVAGRKTSPTSKIIGGRVARSPPTRVGVALTGNTRTPRPSGGAYPERQSGQAAPREFRSSVSPERQAPDPSSPDANGASLSGGGGGGGDGKTRAEASTLPQGAPASPRPEAAAAAASVNDPSGDGKYLSELLNRGKSLRDKMTLAAGPNGEAPASLPSSASNLPPPASADQFTGLTAQPGLVSGALLGSSLRDDIEGIFDTLSDGDPSVDEADALVRDPETRGNEGRVVDLLLEAAGPPPASLAFPALAAVERQRADSLARVRFLRIRLSRLVMFGSMTSAAEGHGWQIRFRLPAFATPPGRSSAAAARRAAGTHAAAAAAAAAVVAKRGIGENTQNARVVSVPVPPRVSASTLGKSKAAARRGRSTSGSAGNAVSVLRVRRGFGACDLVVGETSLLEEVVCAVDVDDACVTQWMDTALEFLLIDGKTDGAPRPRPAAQFKNHPHLRKQQQRREFSTVIPGDRVAAVATIPLRDLVLSADLGVASTLDLIEVSDFWAAEDARAAAAGRTGRGGRPLRNPYRSDVSGGGARPLVLGDRAVGALAVALELVPGEHDGSPEESRPEVERWSKGSRQQGAAGAGHTEKAGAVEEAGEEPTAEEGNDAALRAGTGLVPPPLADVRAQLGPLPGTSGGDPLAGEKAEAIGAEWGAVAELGGPGQNGPSEDNYEPGASPAAPTSSGLPPDLEGSWKEGSGAVAVGPLDANCAVMLRIDKLTLAPAAGPGVEQVRVAYSFTQVEGSTPTVTHRSVHGHRAQLTAGGGGGGGQQRVTPFVLGHQEVFPAPDDSSSWRLGASASRVFEVWGCSADGPEGSGAGTGQTGALLGLAKVSLGPFAAFFECATGQEEAGNTAVSGAANAKGSSLAVGADGPVAVIDPFSGRAVGELHLFLALGASSTIAALLHPISGGAIAGAAENEGGGGTAGDTSTRPGISADEGGGVARDGEEEEEKEKEKKGEREQDAEGRMDWNAAQKEGADGEGGVGALLSMSSQEPPALDDSVAELSMLLNPGRGERPLANNGRSSGSFTGLVRHVVELSAVGELPLALNVGSVGEEGVDEPVGCAIEYVLPSGQASLGFQADETETPSTSGQTHELWWDADSGILNSRARHTIKVPGGMLDKLPSSATDGSSGGSGGSGDLASSAEDRSLNRLLDCMFGRDDIVLSLFWSAGGIGARQRAPWSETDGEHGEKGPNAEAVAEKQERSPLGKAVLRRSDLLPLVGRTSARVVLSLPIEPAGRGKGGKGHGLTVPTALQLSISYRREPSAVARRKYRGSSERRQVADQAASEDGDGSRREGCQGTYQGMYESCEVGRAQGQTDVTGQPAKADLGKTEEKGGGGEDPEEGQVRSGRRHGANGSVSTPKKGPGAEGGSDGGGGSPDSWESDSHTLMHRSSRTEHLLPARTKLCVGVERFSVGAEFVDAGKVAGKEKSLLWVSFDFPRNGGGGQTERKRGGVFVWKPGVEANLRPEAHCSPVAVANRAGRRDRVTVPLQWNVELPVTIDAQFVEFVHTQSLELRVWRGDRADWPDGGTACGVAKVVLRSLLTTLGGVGGDVTISPETVGGVGGGSGGDRAGSMTVRLFFKHRGLGSSNDGAAAAEEYARQPMESANRNEEEKELAAAAEPRHGEGRSNARRRAPVSFREGFDVFCEEQTGGPGGGGGGGGVDDPATPHEGPETATAMSNQGSLSAAEESPQQPRGAWEEEEGALKRNSQKRPPASSVSSLGVESGLRVHVERAMRLGVVASAAAALGDRDVGVGGSVSSPPAALLPSTYVTFRWEEEGKPPLRSPLLLPPMPSAPSVGERVGASQEENRQDTLTTDGEVLTPVVDHSSNPVFNHAAHLRLVDPNDWARVCGPSAALVFRVWRRVRCSWWDAPPTATSAAMAERQPTSLPAGGGVTAAAAGSRFGDKLIGSAVVGLEVLRGAAGAREGRGLRDIDGWYHVLDDLQRPQGQIKVQVQPEPPSSVPDQEAVMPPSADVENKQIIVRASLGIHQYSESTDTGSDNKANSGMDTPPPPTPPPPPLHDTEAHLRSVHALLDSLPAEFRSTQPRRPPLPTSTFSPVRIGTTLELPSPSEGPASTATQSSVTIANLPPPPPPPPHLSRGSTPLDPTAGRYGCEPSSMPELRRMLLSLDRVDRRLFALGDCQDADADHASDDDCCACADNNADGVPGEQGLGGGGGGGESVTSSGVPTNGPPLEPIDADLDDAGVGLGQYLAVSRLQQAWRARCRRNKEALKVEADAEREVYALRRKRREEAAIAIQAAHRRAQARHRAAAAAEERRRWESRQRRRAAACAIIERAWRTFENRRRAAREVAEARGRAAAAVAAAAAKARRAEETVRGAVLVQAVWRGMSARAAAARRFEASRARSRASAAAATATAAAVAPVAVNVALPAGRERLSQPAPTDGTHPLTTVATVTPRPLPTSTFYNQLSQDPRRGHRLRLPEAHLASAASAANLSSSEGLPPPARSLAASHHSGLVQVNRKKEEEERGEEERKSERFGPRPLTRSAGAVRPPRFADQETARIARIMKGNLQHWASTRSSSSGDDVDL